MSDRVAVVIGQRGDYAFVGRKERPVEIDTSGALGEFGAPLCRGVQGNNQNSCLCTYLPRLRRRFEQKTFEKHRAVSDLLRTASTLD